MANASKPIPATTGAPLALMLAHVALFSLIAPLVAITDSAASPFLFNAVWKTALIAGSLVYLALANPTPLRSKRARVLITRALRRPAFFLMIASNMDLVFFNASLRYMDAASATIVFFAAPLGAIWLLTRVFASSRQYSPITPAQAALAIIALCGAALVVISQADANTRATMLGVAIAAPGAAIAALTPFGLKWGQDIRKRLPRDAANRSDFSLDLSLTTAGVAVSHIPSTIISAGIGMTMTETLSPPMIAAAVIGGALVSTPATLLWRAANLKAPSATINALAYAAPVLSVIWLLTLSLTAARQPALFAAGAIAIIAANALLWHSRQSRSTAAAAKEKSAQA